MADSRRKKVNYPQKSGEQSKTAEGILDRKVSRRTAVGTGAVVGAAVAGLIIGGAGGYFAGNAGKGGSTTITSTVAGGTTTVAGSTFTTTVGSGGGGTTTVTSTVTGTGAGGGGSNPLAGTIVVQTLAGGGDQLANIAASRYNSNHAGSKVSTQPIPEANMNASSITAITSGPPPDIIYNSTLPAFNAQVVTPGYALQLDQYVTSYGWDKETLPTFSSYGNVNGHWYWFTIGSIYYGNVYYNADLFTKLNIKPPTDNASLYAAASALKSAGYQGIAHGYQTQPEWFMNTFSDMLMNHISSDQYQALWTSYGPDLYTSNFGSRSLKMTDPPVMDIWNEMQKLGQNALVPGVTTMSDATAISLFASEKAGMYAVGSWGAQTLEAPVGGVSSTTVSSNGSETVLSSTASGTTGFTYAFTPWGYFTPGFASDSAPSNPVRIVTFPTPYFVHYKTKYPALCADFLDSMLSSTIQEVYFTQFGDFPIIPLGTAITPDKYLQQSLTWSNQLAGRPSLAATVDTALHDPIENAIGAILSGQQTPSAAAQSVEQLAIQLNQTGPPASSSSGSSSSSSGSGSSSGSTTSVSSSSASASS